jgi:hypothetical protein
MRERPQCARKQKLRLRRRVRLRFVQGRRLNMMMETAAFRAKRTMRRGQLPRLTLAKSTGDTVSGASAREAELAAQRVQDRHAQGPL